MTRYYREKNYWITQVLKVIFSDIAPKFYNIAPHPFILKGGTSINLAYPIIKRTTDDIDLSYSLALLGLKPLNPKSSDSRSYLESRAKMADSASILFLKDYFAPILKDMINKNHLPLSIEIENKKPLNIKVFCPENIVLTIETGGRSINTPAHEINISGNRINKYKAWVLSPQRTLLEKIFGLHTDNIRSIIHHSHVKFFYDIIKIHEYNNSWITNREMLDEIADFNYIYYRWHSDSCKSIKIGPIQIVPTNHQIQKIYREDWNNMGYLFYNRKIPFSFSHLIKKIQIIQDIINNKKAPIQEP